MLSKERTEKLQKDAESDETNIQAIVSQLGDARKIAVKLTQELNSKYGLEFGGGIKVDYDIFEKTFKIQTANGKAFLLEFSELADLPFKLMIYRKEYFIHKEKEERKKNEANFAISAL